MKLLLLLMFISTSLNAAPPVTHQFTNGTTIEASQVNANYQELADRIEVSDNTLAVTTNSSEIAVLQGQITSLQNQLTALQTITQKQFIGFTSADALSRNYLRMTAQCQSEYAGSRVCTVKEIVETVDLPVIPDNVTARVAPELGLDADYGGSTSILSSIYLGNQISQNTLSCLIYSTGTAVIDSIPFSANCSTTDSYKVACCR